MREFRVYRSMQLDDIKASVRPAMREQIDSLFGSFSQQLGTDDLDRFVSWLHDEGHISAQTFRGLHSGGKLVLTSFETLSEATYYPDEIEREELLDEFEPDERTEAQEGAPPRYQFLGKLAAGAMGEIHVVRDRELQRKVALKRMHASIARKAKLARRFLNEAQITAQLDHPNIVPVYTLDASKEKPLSYTMKLIRGNTFAQVIEEAQAFYDENRPLDEDHLLSTRLDHFVRACDALSYAHSRGVVHRDLKPENIMVGAYGEVYVMDWGIARIMGQPEESHEDIVELGSAAVQQTRFGAVLGTPAYMSPEQAAGLNDVLDGRSDGYSLGLILYELVCLRPAVTGADTMAILDRMQDGQLDEIRHHSPREDIAPELVAIIHKATARRPDDRYQTVKELAEDVRRFQRGEPVRALPEGPLQRLYRWISRHRELVLSVALFAFMFAGALTIASLASTLFTLSRGTAREQKISQLLSEVSRRGHLIDTRFQGYQALLRVLAASALEARGRDKDLIGPSYYITSDAVGRGERFPDLADASVYGRPVSLDFPVTAIAPELAPVEADLAARRLSLLRMPLRRVLLESHASGMLAVDAAAARARLLEEMSPVRWAFVGLDTGVGIVYPGHEGVPPGLDVRREPWYQAVIERANPTSVADGAGLTDRFAPVWGNPHLDDKGVDTLLPVSMGIHDDQGELVGVAALEVGFAYIQDNLLSLPGVEYAEAFVLDEEGRILMSTRAEADASSQSVLRTRSLRRKKFEVEAVTEAVAERGGGTLEIPGEQGGTDLVVWSRMGDLGWTYLVRGPRNELMR